MVAFLFPFASKRTEINEIRTNNTQEAFGRYCRQNNTRPEHLPEHGNKMKEKGNDISKPERLSPSRARKERYKAVVVSYYLKGYNGQEVAELASHELGGARISRIFVNKAVKEAIQLWRKQKDALIADHKAIELEKINKLEATYWEAWESSKKSQKTTTVRTKATVTGKEETNQERHQTGEPRFLQGIENCIKQRCAILGIEAPQVVIQNNNSNSTTIVRKVVFKTRETTIRPQIFETPTE